jgi:hypothetical protein
LQVSQIAIPQKAELLKTNDPPEGLQSDTSAIFEEKFFPEVEQNKPAKPANLQEEEEEITDDPRALEIGQRVSTPQGIGIVVQRWPHLIGVKVDGAREVAYFRGPEEIARIRPFHTPGGPVEQEEKPP